jgi:hypothetical protein
MRKDLVDFVSYYFQETVVFEKDVLNISFENYRENKNENEIDSLLIGVLNLNQVEQLAMKFSRVKQLVVKIDDGINYERGIQVTINKK